MRIADTPDATRAKTGRMGAARGITILALFAGLTLPLMPVQAVLLRTNTLWARRFPHWYHRQVCRLFGIRITVEGALAPGKAVLLVSNHTSWLDIPVLSAVAPVSFVAKKEVGSWPGVSALARLQRSVFVDRQRRSATADTAGEIQERLAAGDAIVLFAEGTSSDGNRVLPFKTSLFGAVKTQGGGAENVATDAVVQTVAIVYTKLHGIPLGRADRVRVGWYGDMEMTGHAWDVLKSGPLDVTVRIGVPVALDAFADRKALARHTEREVRENVLRILRCKAAGDSIEPVVPKASALPPVVRATGRKWT